MSCKCFGAASVVERRRSSSGQTNHGLDGMQDMCKCFASMFKIIINIMLDLSLPLI